MMREAVACLPQPRRDAARCDSSTHHREAKRRLVCEWGDTRRKFMCHSMRKSLLSALYGVYAAEGKISLDRTLGELGVDDAPDPLTAAEKLCHALGLELADRAKPAAKRKGKEQA